MKKYLHVLAMAIGAVFFTACATSAPQIVIPSYTAPKEVAKLSKIKTKDEFIAKGAYLAIWLDPEVKGAKKSNLKLQKMLLSSIKSSITQTNFIALDPLGDENSVALHMEILSYKYSKTANKRELYLEVLFTLSRGVDEFLVKKYAKKLSRQSKNKKRLPNEDQLASRAVDKIVKYFISDISPLKTKQLRTFKEFPSELEMVVEFAKRGDFANAIKLMKHYKGNRDYSYYYNLAILYEAQASRTEDLKTLQMAEHYYDKALEKGGMTDKLVVDAKARFDRFYNLLRQTKANQKNNKALLDERNEMVGSSADEFE